MLVNKIIYNRANLKEKYIGLTNWKNSPDGLIYKYDVVIAKNYLNDEYAYSQGRKISSVIFNEFIRNRS